MREVYNGSGAIAYTCCVIWSAPGAVPHDVARGSSSDPGRIRLRGGAGPPARAPRQARDDERPRRRGDPVQPARNRVARGGRRRNWAAGRRMRLQLALAGLVASAGLGSVAAADGSVSVRGVYYKERATRVIQPMLDGMFEAGARGLVTTHLLVDSITSASTRPGSTRNVTRAGSVTTTCSGRSSSPARASTRASPTTRRSTSVPAPSSSSPRRTPC